MTKSFKIISWIAAIIASLIMVQTLYFKFSAAPESVYIFTTLGLEPYGRIGIGIAELIASILLLIPNSRLFGAVLGIGIMAGAVIFHITKLGIEVMNDGGYLFLLSILVLTTCFVCMLIERDKLFGFIKRFILSKKK